MCIFLIIKVTSVMWALANHQLNKVMQRFDMKAIKTCFPGIEGHLLITFPLLNGFLAYFCRQLIQKDGCLDGLLQPPRGFRWGYEERACIWGIPKWHRKIVWKSTNMPFPLTGLG